MSLACPSHCLPFGRRFDGDSSKCSISWQERVLVNGGVSIGAIGDVSGKLFGR